jgi:hypothetical protein
MYHPEHNGKEERKSDNTNGRQSKELKIKLPFPSCNEYSGTENYDA